MITSPYAEQIAVKPPAPAMSAKAGIQRQNSQPAAASSDGLDWCDLAYSQDWQGAILAYLRQRWRQVVPIWVVANAIAAEDLFAPNFCRET